MMTKAPKKFDDKPGETVIRPDPVRPGQPDIEATSSIPAHNVGEIEGVIQKKDAPGAPIVEKAPDEKDLQEGKITPQAVEKPQYDFGVTEEDILAGKVSPTAVRETERSVARDDELNDMITVARNRTQLARLNRAEVAEVFSVLKAEGYEVRKVGGNAMTENEAIRAA